MLQVNGKINEHAFAQPVLDEMKQALSAFERTLPQFGGDTQVIFCTRSAHMISEMEAEIVEALPQLTAEQQSQVQLIASYICRLTFLSAACKSVGRYDCFQDVQFQCFKQLIDLPMPHHLAGTQMQQMLEIWRAELRNRSMAKLPTQSLDF